MLWQALIIFLQGDRAWRLFAPWSSLFSTASHDGNVAFSQRENPDDLIFKTSFWPGPEPDVHFVPTFTRHDRARHRSETGRIGEVLLRKHLKMLEGTFLSVRAQRIRHGHGTYAHRTFGTARSHPEGKLVTTHPHATLTFAHSPDPDDAYMFYGFEVGAVKIPGYEVRHHLEDIQTLNERALRGEFEITA